MREKFATLVDEALLADLRQIAASEGRELDAVVEEAFAALIERRRHAEPRPEVLAAHAESHTKFRSLYEKLAK